MCVYLCFYVYETNTTFSHTHLLSRTRGCVYTLYLRVNTSTLCTLHTHTHTHTHIHWKAHEVQSAYLWVKGLVHKECGAVEMCGWLNSVWIYSSFTELNLPPPPILAYALTHTKDSVDRLANFNIPCPACEYVCSHVCTNESAI